jgi:glutathione S-transferase
VRRRQVPAIAYGGPKVPADQPSPQSIKLAESLILVEFVADLYPQSGLLPSDPVVRAQARFFVDAVSTKLIPAYMAWLRKGESYENFLKGVEAIQALLPQDAPFAVGEAFTVADIAILPVSFSRSAGDCGENRELASHDILCAVPRTDGRGVA